MARCALDAPCSCRHLPCLRAPCDPTPHTHTQYTTAPPCATCALMHRSIETNHMAEGIKLGLRDTREQNSGGALVCVHCVPGGNMGGWVDGWVVGVGGGVGVVVGGWWWCVCVCGGGGGGGWMLLACTGAPWWQRIASRRAPKGVEARSRAMQCGPGLSPAAAVSGDRRRQRPEIPPPPPPPGRARRGAWPAGGVRGRLAPLLSAALPHRAGGRAAAGAGWLPRQQGPLPAAGQAETRAARAMTRDPHTTTPTIATMHRPQMVRFYYKQDVQQKAKILRKASGRGRGGRGQLS